jgi:hypothetical protein
MLLENFVEVLVPDKVEDEVVLSFLLGIETDIVFHPNFVEHVENSRF